MADLAVGTVFAGHRIEGVAGRGGMGVVYRATHLRLHRVVGLKVIAPQLAVDPGFRERFMREARTAAALDHPNAVTVYDAGEEDGALYMTMRFIEGSDLDRLVSARGPMTPDEAVRVVTGAAQALDAAHALGMVHRDVKPGNVLIDAGGGVHLGDFGLMKVLDGADSLTGTGMFVGTARYAAPEQLLGRPVGPHSDVYSLAAVLFYALTGRPPFERESAHAVAYAHATAPRPLAGQYAPGIPAALDEVIVRGMALDPGERPASAGALAAAARAALTDSGPALGAVQQLTEASPSAAVTEPGTMAPVHAGAPSPPAAPARPGVPPAESPPAPPARRRARAPLILAAAVAAAAVVAVVVWLAAGGDGGGTSARDARVDLTVPVGKTPGGIALGAGAVWVTLYEGGQVARLDPDTGRALGPPLRVGARPADVAVADSETVWVSNSRDDTLSRIHPPTARVDDPVSSGGITPWGIHATDTRLWVVNQDPARVAPLATADGAPAGSAVAVPGRPYYLTVGYGWVWVPGPEADVVTRINPNTGVVEGEPIPVGDGPLDVAESDGTVWVTNNEDGTVTRLDGNSAAQIGEPIPVGLSPHGVVVAGGLVWVANDGDDTVVRIDPAAGEVVGDPIPVGSNPRTIAAGDRAVWVVNHDDGTVSRIAW